jgi:nucleoside-diphosphate-sugar epimerase
MLLHLAWCSKPGQFWNSEENFLWLSASQELFRSFYFFGGQRALGLGTCAEFQWIGQNYNEQLTPSKPDTIYGRCKLAAALVLEAAAMAGGGSAAWARAFFPYGPGEPEGRFIPSLICGLLKGQTIPCSHGDQIRDFIYVTDVAEGLTELLCHEATGTFNLGTGRAVSLRHLANLITARLGHCELVQFGARAAQPGDPGRVVADMSRTFSVSGWRATVSLEQGIEHTITDWRERLHLQKEHG